MIWFDKSVTADDAPDRDDDEDTKSFESTGKDDEDEGDDDDEDDDDEDDEAMNGWVASNALDVLSILVILLLLILRLVKISSAILRVTREDEFSSKSISFLIFGLDSIKMFVWLLAADDTLEDEAVVELDIWLNDESTVFPFVLFKLLYWT